MAIQIKKAVRERVWLKIVAMGPAGSGKTYGTIGLAKGLAPTGKVLVVDTENSSASYYADKWDFDVVDMHAPFTSQKYMEVLQEAVRLGYEVIVIDSMSHEWAASGGVLDKKADFDRQKGEKWGNWQDAKKPHALFKEAWLQAPIHVVATMRSKMEYVLETNDKGKQVPRKVGLAPIQDGDSEYEFGVAFEIDRDSHLATAAKDRTGLFDGRSFPLNEAVGQELAAWLASGAQPSTSNAPDGKDQPCGTATQAPATAAGNQSPKGKATSNVSPGGNGGSSTQPAASKPEQSEMRNGQQTSSLPVPSNPPTEPPAEWVEAITELAAATLGMPEQTRSKLVATWEAEGPEKLKELQAEIATIRQAMEPATVGAAIAQMPQAEKAPVSGAASDFVDDMDPDTDEASGGISPEQYAALTQLIGAFGINRDALRSYCFKSGHLLPGANGPTLARMKASYFAQLRDKLCNKKIAAGNETWSARTVRIINATTTTTYQPNTAKK